MIVQDPSRVIMGSKPESFGVRGYTVEEMVKEFDAVAGINAGGFYDRERGRQFGKYAFDIVYHSLPFWGAKLLLFRDICKFFT